METTQHDEKIIRLGEALRSARLNHRPPLTLKEIGQCPTAPRTWSHAHLSKVERGLETPKPNLVEWYEQCTEVPHGYLMDLYHHVVGDRDNPGQAASPDDAWIVERIEQRVHLHLDKPYVLEIMDLLATHDGVDSLQLLVDTRRPDAGPEEFLPRIDAGVASLELLWQAGTVASVRLHLHRSFAKGEWHRIRLEYDVPPVEEHERYFCIATRRPHTRDAVVVVKFPSGLPVVPWAIRGRSYEEVNAAFGTTSSSETDVATIIGSAEPLHLDPDGIARVRFHSLQPGCRYGIGWQSAL